MERPRRSLASIFVSSLVLGVFALGYGSFAMVVPAAIIAFLIVECAQSVNRSFRRFFSRSAVLIVGFSAPIVLWALFVYWRTGQALYSLETDYYRQFVWILDAWSGGRGVLGHRLASSLSVYAQSIRTVAVVPVLVLGALVALRFFSWIGRREPFISTSWNSVLIACAITATVSLLFFGLLGYYADRLTWNVVPALLVAAVPFGSEWWTRLSQNSRSWLGLLWSAAALAWLVFNVAKAGPYS